jgi:hypothetical protein
VSFGIFEAAVSSEAETGIAKQAAVDQFNAAVYDVREQLGPSLFQASSIQEFRDRVAMMKNDQSVYRIIGEHLMPVTGVVRRIVGQRGILEKEFRTRIAKEQEEDLGPSYPPGGDYDPDRARHLNDKYWEEQNRQKEFKARIACGGTCTGPQKCESCKAREASFVKGAPAGGLGPSPKGIEGPSAPKGVGGPPGVSQPNPTPGAPGVPQPPGANIHTPLTGPSQPWPGTNVHANVRYADGDDPTRRPWRGRTQSRQ